MKNIKLKAVIVMISIILVIVVLGFSSGSQLTWYGFDEGMQKAKDENKQVLVDVYTDWCSWCKVMDEKTYTDPGVVTILNQKFVLIKLNPEKDGPVMFGGKSYNADQFAQGIGVNGYPATAFFESNDKMITLVPGYLKADEFLPIVEYIGDKKYNEIGFDDYLKQRQKN
jgi:thioredoxin-related protein